jgi:endonuclease-3 related protein
VWNICIFTCLVGACCSGLRVETELSGISMGMNMHDQLMEIYQRLYRHFGPRHWWPADSPFEMIVGAILTQNVSWQSAAAAIFNLKEAGLLSLDGLLGCDREALAVLLRPARYHIQKARKLQEFCLLVTGCYQGSLQALLDEETSLLRQSLLATYGIGPETADAIILYAANKPVFVIDAYTLRVFERLGLVSEKATYWEMQSLMMQNLPAEVLLYNEYHAQLDAFGHHTCLKSRPRCPSCPLADLCRRPTDAMGSRVMLPGRRMVHQRE